MRVELICMSRCDEVIVVDTVLCVKGEKGLPLGQ
jgi:hypothetical protein